jgi:hypothetical protein
VLWDANSGPPSEVSVSGMPKVENVSQSALMSPYVPSLEVKTMGQFDNRSTSTRYVAPSWWKKSARMGTPGWSMAWQVEMGHCCCRWRSSCACQ